ncbi:hypothetical protein Bca4012_089697 [Brassica carinata]|uniref:Uncharacterized protein n=2 Tax=Brassica TaxID=3705 RepID=A0A8X7PAG7_BRACI|nr:PREDICTED: DNA repair protein RAD5 [Brassica oleracea var. oleracea]XP_022550808.1 helicase-like transcription factor CHR28 [Brassica napus]KAG2247173.1 hypothetical protein Bca52824_086801 [Brassica carinata]CAF2075880.1 unnamed protein product [Brassica napus]
MGEEGSAVALGDGFPPDDLDVGFEFEDDDEDLTIDFETIYRILDEKPPDSSEGSQENSSPAGSGSSPDELNNSHLQNGIQMVDSFASRDSYTLRGSPSGTGSFDDHVKLASGLSPSPARTCSASLKDWFSVSPDEKPVEPYAMSAFCYHSNTLGNGADNPLSPAHNCYNTSGPSLTEHTPSFAFQFFPNKEEAVNDVDSGVSECLSDGARRMVFDTHGRVDYGSSDRKPVVDFSSARGIGFNCESNSSVPLPSAKPYNRFDSHFADNCSSTFQGNKAAPVKVKPEAESEKLVCSSVPKEESNIDPVYAPGETSHWWSGASGCSVSYQTDIQEGFAFMAQQTGFPSQDSGNSSNFYDSNACLQYVAADPSSATQINGYVDSLTQVNQEHIQPRSVDYNFSNASLESVQSLSPESISDSDDDSDVYIIETNGQSANPYRPLAMKIPVVSSQYSPSGHTFNQPGGTRLQSNKENMIFQAALQDLSLPEAEANLPDGVLAVPLMRHQRIALSWMAHKETTGFPCSGGILADDQGLGKTISTIALILKERSTPSRTCEESIKKEVFDLESEGGECASSKPNGQSEQVDGNSVDKVRGRPAAGTLVVCPTSVMRQWGDEIRKKVTTEAKLSVLVYHGSSRTKDPHELAKYDVVVTTYSIVSMEVPKQPLVDDEDEEKDDLHNGEGAAAGLCPNKKRKYPPDSQKKGSKKKKRLDRASAEAQSGPLAKVSWFRVVLDEAQSIKNHKTQVARACWGLRAKRRWCLSGTPIQNSIDDLYSYFRFLKYDPYSSYVWFCNSIKNPVAKTPVKGYQKLQAILKTVMLRRTKGSLIDGKPVISLPPKSIELRKVEFTEEERDFYSNLEKESRSQFQEYKEAGTVKQNYVNILLMLLRLRQACDHPLLVKGEYSFTWESSLGLAKKENFSETSLQICGICNDSPEDAVVSVCGHVFCKQCFYECLTGDDNICPIANCNGRLTAMPSMHDNATSVHVETVDSCSEGLPYESSKIKAALEILQSLARPQDLTDIKQITQKGADSSLSATPLKVVGEKAIVFSQWTKMLDLLEASLISSRIQYRRLDGTMSVAARDKAVQDFNTLPEVTVMIMSLKAASLGLNMVAACHVLMLDLWWNPTTEDQAIDRAHRIGQTRPVTVVRFTVKETVEDRILALQQKKRMMVASAFGEDEKGSRQSHLTVEDLNYLFMAD